MRGVPKVLYLTIGASVMILFFMFYSFNIDEDKIVLGYASMSSSGVKKDMNIEDVVNQVNTVRELVTSDNGPSVDRNGITGEDVIAYARQFVGNPYVWGGNSLTHGIDCSGYVHEVYKHFSYDLPRFSGSFASVGKEIPLEQIELGDIVVYNGHVAMYSGDGKIIEAQGRRWGITDYRTVDHAPIVAIRRVIGEVL